MDLNKQSRICHSNLKSPQFIQMTVKIESPCYELNKHSIEVVNPFPQAGDFRIVLVEAKSDLSPTTDKNGRQLKNKKVKKVKSRIDHGQKKSNMADREDTPPEPIRTVVKPPQMDGMF